MVEVRQATKNDIPWILSELESFAKFYDTRKNLFGDLDYAEKYMDQVIEGHLVLVSHIGDELTGFIAGLLAKHPFNPEIEILQELWWWVTEKHRGGRSGLKLFKQFSAYGEKYCDWTIFTIERESPINDKVLLKNGFRHKETTYLRESSWQPSQQ